MRHWSSDTTTHQPSCGPTSRETASSPSNYPERPCPANYRKRPAGTVEKKLIATFEMDGRLFPNQEFLITETGHDIFVGLQWMRERDLRCGTEEIMWPEDIPANAKFCSSITLPPTCRLDRQVSPAVQVDAVRHDKLMAKDEKKHQILRRSWRQPTAQPNTTPPNGPSTSGFP